MKLKVTCKCGREITPSDAARVMQQKRRPLTSAKAKEMRKKQLEAKI